MNHRAIVNVAVGGHYPELQARLRQACAEHCPAADLWFLSSLPTGCPPHEAHQYAFKLAAMRQAIDRGYRFILWMDCTFIPIAPISVIWEAIERDGWYIPRQGTASLGRWTSDAALAEFNLDRDAAMNIQLCYSGLVGLDMASPRGCAIWSGWNDQAHTFSGAHKNDPGEPIHEWGNKWAGHVSYDLRVQGHRHDESALSFVLYSLGLAPRGGEFLTVENPRSGVIGRNLAHDLVCR